jgi:hypothetical protein
MDGLIQFGQAVLPGSTRVISASGDDARAMLQVTSRVKFGPDAPEMTLDGARLYRLDENQKIIEERVIFSSHPSDVAIGDRGPLEVPGLPRFLERH